MILSSHDVDARERVARSLFVEILDFAHADLMVPLGEANDANLPTDARLLAQRDAFSVLYIPLDGADDNQVKTATAAAAAKNRRRPKSRANPCYFSPTGMATNSTSFTLTCQEPGRDCSAWWLTGHSRPALSSSKSPTCGATTASQI